MESNKCPGAKWIFLKTHVIANQFCCQVWNKVYKDYLSYQNVETRNRIQNEMLDALTFSCEKPCQQDYFAKCKLLSADAFQANIFMQVHVYFPRFPYTGAI